MIRIVLIRFPILFIQVIVLPLFFATKEVYSWLERGTKTIDVRKGKPRAGDSAVFQSGTKQLRLHIVKIETGLLSEVIRPDNYSKIIPTACGVEEARSYLRKLYSAYTGTFTAYYLSKSEN
jgi:hypothetical protein